MFSRRVTGSFPSKVTLILVLGSCSRWLAAQDFDISTRPEATQVDRGGTATSAAIAAPSAALDGPSQAGSAGQTKPIGKKELEPYETSIAERLLRSCQYQYQLLEQPACLVATVATKAGTETATIANPDKWLQQHS